MHLFYNINNFVPQNLDKLLKKIQNIVDRSTDNDVLDACAKTLEFLCTEGTAIYTRCDVARSTIIDTLVNKYKEAMDDWRSLIEGVLAFLMLSCGIYLMVYLIQK